MRGRELLEKMGLADPAYVAEAENAGARRGKFRWVWAAAACLILAAGLIYFYPRLDGGRAGAVAAAEYPERVKRDGGDLMDRLDERGRLLPLREIYNGTLNSYYASVLPALLSGDGEGNEVFSPLNLYMSLATLAEVTGGESREQILSLLDCDDLDTLRERAGALWDANYRDDGRVHTLLANSIWLSDDISYSQKTLEALARDYYASSFSGEMGSRELNEALQAWLNENTDNMLTKEVSDVRTSRDTVVALASALSYSSRWTFEFDLEDTARDIFHAPGGDVTADFMHERIYGAYYWGEKFTAIDLPLDGHDKLTVILPDEGVEAAELLGDSEVISLLSPLSGFENVRSTWIDVAMPRTDVSASMDLAGQLGALGIRDVFTPGVADFSPLLSGGNSENVFLSEIQHAARVTIDEEGCKAAAYTVDLPIMDMPPAEVVSFQADRPFLLALTVEGGEILMAALVRNP